MAVSFIGGRNRNTRRIPLTYKLLLNNDSLCQAWILYTQKWDRRGHDGMTVGFTTTCAISSHHHDICEFESRSWWGVLDAKLCDKVCQWLATGRWFSSDTLVPVSQKVVNRKLGRTIIFTVYDRFTKLTEFRNTTFFGRKLPTGSEQL